jgi:hypothetical protein
MPMSRHTTAARGVEVTFWNSAAGRVPAPLGAANRMFRAAIGFSKNSGQGSASLNFSRVAGVALLFDKTELPGPIWTWPPAGMCPLSEGRWKTGKFVSH